MLILFKCIFGSHLYGTDSENSDKDYKGIFMPSEEEILLGKVPKSINTSTKKGSEKNTSEDVDIELYSLHYFIHLACEGETVALDMLHAPKEMILIDSPLWDRILKNKEKFYTRNLKAFIGYARRQASKYGIKGSRLNDAKRVIDVLSKHNPEHKLQKVWDKLPIGEHIFKHPAEAFHNNEKMFEVCGRKVGETASIGYAKDVVSKFHDAYGKRAKMAAENKGIDWKAVSHALRAAYQVKEILTENKITFPLKNADFLLKVKNGIYDYSTEIAPLLDSLMDNVEILSQKSELPMKVSRGFWNDFIIEEIKNEYFYH